MSTKSNFTLTAIPKVELLASDFPIHQVVVYTDRAEVSRRFTFSTPETNVEIQINKLSRYCDRDSIRVDAGNDIKILDVSNKEIRKKAEEDALPEDDKEELKELKELEERRRKLKVQLEVLEKEEKQWKDYANLVKNDKMAESYLKESVVESFVEFEKSYNEAIRVLELQKLELRETLVELNKPRTYKNKKVAQLKRDEVSTQIIILAELRGEVKLREFLVTYVITNASWRPRYDIRANSESSCLELHYQAEISQNTDEPWNNVKISLSTAQPALGGEAPSFDESWHLDFKAPPRPPSPDVVYEEILTNMASLNYRSSVLQSSGWDGVQKASPGRGGGGRRHWESVAVASTKAGVAGMLFEVAGTSTIPSDNLSHKVTVGLLQLLPEFYYVCVPKVVTQAYLKARVKNTSDYALLAGPVNIFLDRCFVAKSTLKDISPNEDFEVSLGTDSAVKVKYPAHAKLQATAGFVSRTQQISFRQDIVVRNGRSGNITVKVIDQVPVSGDEPLKVALQDPFQKVELKTGQEELQENDMTITGAKQPRFYPSKGQLEWVFNVVPGAEEKLRFAYEVSHPNGETVDL